MAASNGRERLSLLIGLALLIALAVPGAASASGSLKVTSFPSGAQVIVDNVNTGKTTPMSISLTEGDHSVLVQIAGSGWNPDTRVVTIVPGNNDLSVTLLPIVTQGPPGPEGPQGPEGPAGPPGPLPAPVGGSITGFVTNSCSPGGYAGALVYIPGRPFMTKTGTSGFFLFQSVPEGGYTVVTEALGRIQLSTPAVVPTGGMADLGPLNFQDLLHDPNNCGLCGNVCTSGVCVNGVCQPAPIVCGDGICSSSEDASNCPNDCEVIP